MNFDVERMVKDFPGGPFGFIATLAMPLIFVGRLLIREIFRIEIKRIQESLNKVERVVHKLEFKTETLDTMGRELSGLEKAVVSLRIELAAVKQQLKLFSIRSIK